MSGLSHLAKYCVLLIDVQSATPVAAHHEVRRTILVEIHDSTAVRIIAWLRKTGLLRHIQKLPILIVSKQRIGKPVNAVGRGADRSSSCEKQIKITILRNLAEGLSRKLRRALRENSVLGR